MMPAGHVMHGRYAWEVRHTRRPSAMHGGLCAYTHHEFRSTLLRCRAETKHATRPWCCAMFLCTPYEPAKVPGISGIPPISPFAAHSLRIDGPIYMPGSASPQFSMLQSKLFFFGLDRLFKCNDAPMEPSCDQLRFLCFPVVCGYCVPWRSN